MKKKSILYILPYIYLSIAHSTHSIHDEKSESSTFSNRKRTINLVDAEDNKRIEILGSKFKYLKTHHHSQQPLTVQMQQAENSNRAIELYNIAHKNIENRRAEDSLDQRIATFNICKKSAQLGSLKAYFLLGTLYYHGYGTEKNYDKAFRFFTKVAKHADYPEINYSLAKCYIKGRGTEANYFLGLQLLTKSATKNCILSQYDLANLLLSNITDNKNSYPTAIYWLTESAKNQYTEAQYQLGRLYFEGIFVEKNQKNAYKWLQEASKNGHRKAKDFITLLEKSSQQTA
ncbi:MAG: hypothetical protein C0432_04430 [Candidatus Puniceispirillum sp.]|nr:hypothetical protein [Candidatus Pelagibacter sp.]MBA4283522.1 hypothetical protein [Candidatus Puniceispirillum sp.]